MKNQAEKYIMPTRQNALSEWLQMKLGDQPFTLKKLAGDASFRRYFRLSTATSTHVVMDAPPEKEAMAPFAHIQQLLSSIDIITPTVHAVSHEQGFALLDDLGDNLFLNQLTAPIQDDLYQSAIDTLIQMQQCPSKSLPVLDKPHMLREMALFQDWFLGAYLQLTLTPTETNLLNTSLHHIADRIERQPLLFVHRDYHSRNLMVMDGHTPPRLGVIDFQDAMQGPVTYDLVSLLKDAYTQLPETAYHAYLAYFHQHQPLVQTWSLPTLMDEVDYGGLQRHLKILGIFCRLHLRDNKPGYLGDLPLVMHYTMTCLTRHAALEPLHQFMAARVLPRFRETTAT